MKFVANVIRLTAAFLIAETVYLALSQLIGFIYSRPRYFDIHNQELPVGR